MVSVLDALRSRMTQRSLNALDTVAAAARAAARGERYDIGALETAIDQAGITMADFEAAVATAKQRQAWMADFEKLANSSGKVQKLEAAASADKAKFEAARTAYLERATAIEAELAAHRATLGRAQDARNLLLDADQVPGTIGGQYREAVAAAYAADLAVAEARKALREHTERVKNEEGFIKQILAQQAGELKPPQIFLKGEQPPGEESYRLQEHRKMLARAQRRQAEAQSQLTEAENSAALAHKAVEQLIPEVLKA